MESVKIAAEIYMNYNFQFNHINYTEKTKTSICTEKKRVEITDIHTHPSIFPTIILHIPTTLHELLAFL